MKKIPSLFARTPDGKQLTREYHPAASWVVQGEGVPRDFDGLVEFLRGGGIEGIVWWRDIADVNCDKVKITAAALGVHR